MTGRSAVNITVIGAAGFIGSNLHAALRRARIPVVGVTTPSSAADRRAGEEAVRRADIVFYLAGTITPALAAQEPDRIAADLAAFSAYLEMCRRGGRRPTVALLGSGGTVYSPTRPPPYAETSPAGPTSAYGQAKLAQESVLLAASAHVRPVILRVSNVYGPGQRARDGFGVVPHWLQAAATGRPLRIFGDPLTRRDYVYIDDVIAALLRVCDRHDDIRTRESLDGAVVNIGAGVPTSLAELLTVVQSAAGATVGVQYGDRRAFDRRDVWLDIRAAEAALDWRPTTNLRTGIGRAWRALTVAGAATLPEGRRVEHPRDRPRLTAVAGRRRHHEEGVR